MHTANYRKTTIKHAKKKRKSSNRTVEIKVCHFNNKKTRAGKERKKTEAKNKQTKNTLVNPFFFSQNVSTLSCGSHNLP